MILMSGGIDSAVASLFALKRSTVKIFLTFQYQQTNEKEIRCAKRLVRSLGRNARHIIYPLDFSPIAKSRRSLLLPKGRKKQKHFRFYVPARNLIFLAYAAALAESYDIDEIYMGSNFQDAPGFQDFGYPDSGRTFIKLAQKIIRKGLKYRPDIRIIGPLVNRNKFEVIRYGADRKLDFRMTWSCYLNQKYACGTCPACLSRIINFHWAGLKDPIPYRYPYDEALEFALSHYIAPRH